MGLGRHLQQIFRPEKLPEGISPGYLDRVFYKILWHIWNDFRHTCFSQETHMLTPGIWKSVKVKYRLQKKFLRAKNLIRKDALHNEVKQYRNYINILTENSKANHYQKSSQDHKINLCKTWEGVKMIINVNKTTKK